MHTRPSIDETLTAWQYSSVGLVYGISTRVDLNVWYGYPDDTPGTAQDKPAQETAPARYDYNVIYRVRTRETGWLPEVVNNTDYAGWNGYAGNGRPIDAVEIYYCTPSRAVAYRYASYRVMVQGRSTYYGPQIDNLTTNGMDGYAGMFGRKITRLQISLVTR